MKAYQETRSLHTDALSYEARIDNTEHEAMKALGTRDYERLLTLTGRLIGLKAGLNEVYYRMETSTEGFCACEKSKATR